jgi:hypothetical protein
LAESLVTLLAGGGTRRILAFTIVHFVTSRPDGMTYLAVNTVGDVPGHLLAARVNNGIRRAAFERRTRGTMKEEHGKKLDPNDSAIPAEPDKPTALPDEDLDKVAGGIGDTSGTETPGDGSKRIHSYIGHVTLVK